MLAIKPGRFNRDIPNHVIYISSKDGDDRTVHDIKIYDHTSGRGNDKITVAETGVKRLKDKELQARRSENGRKHRYGEKQRRITEGGSLQYAEHQ